MKFGIFYKYLVLFFLASSSLFAQSIDNLVSIEFGATSFPIERPFTISVIISKSDNRPTIAFPDIPGFSKKGTSASVTMSEVGGKTVTNQVIIQNYQAKAPGRFRLPPFGLTVNDEVIQSEGVVLTVQPSATSVSASTTATVNVPVSSNAAFLALRTSKSAIYVREGVTLTLSIFVSDNYPYELSFKPLDQQLAAITKQIRPVNAWEENLAITELKPLPAHINGKRYKEVRLFQSIFFPLSNQPLRLPAVSLWLARTRPVIGPPSAQPERLVLASKPVTVSVRALPYHPMRGRLPVGTFRLEEGLDRQQVNAGKSVRYSFTVLGEGNIATLPAPQLLNETIDTDIFPPEERQVIHHSDDRVIGHKTFSYFIVPHENGVVPLANRFQWIYFDPQTARYDTLRPTAQLEVGSHDALLVGNASAPNGMSGTAATGLMSNSLYAGIDALDSTRQPVSIPVLVRAVANVLIVLMLLGMVFIFFKK